MNTITITGKVNYIKKVSDKFGTFSISDSNYLGKDKDGKGEYSNAYLNCTCFGYALNKIAAAGDGAEVVVTGTLIEDSYTDKSGAERKSWKVKVSECLLASSASGSRKKGFNTDDDLPF